MRELTEYRDLLRTLPILVYKKVADLLEEKAVHAGAVTPEQLRSVFEAMMKECKLKETLEEVRQHALGRRVPDSGEVKVAVAAQSNGAPPPDGMWFFHGPPVSAWRRVPVGWAFPDVVPRLAFQQYQLGNAELKIGPLKKLKPTDMPDKKMKRRCVVTTRVLLTTCYNVQTVCFQEAQ